MSKITRNLNEGETLSFDGGRVVLTMLRRSGRMARIAVEMAADVRLDKPKAVQPPKVAPPQALADGEVTA